MNTQDLLDVLAIAREAVMIERQACAQMAEDMGYPDVAAALRRRASEEPR